MHIYIHRGPEKRSCCAAIYNTWRAATRGIGLVCSMQWGATRKGDQLGLPPADQIPFCVTSFSGGRGDFYYVPSELIYAQRWAN